MATTSRLYSTWGMGGAGGGKGDAYVILRLPSVRVAQCIVTQRQAVAGSGSDAKSSEVGQMQQRRQRHTAVFVDEPQQSGVVQVRVEIQHQRWRWTSGGKVRPQADLPWRELKRPHRR